MLSYRHAFHAGGPADVLKHVVLAATVEAMLAPHGDRPADPIYLLDTHAGAGWYDLDAAMAVKLGEWRQGVLPLLRAADPPLLVQPLLRLVRSLNPDRRLRWYPGSAEILARAQRGRDRLDLVELHPTEHATLVARYDGRAGLKIVKDDGLRHLTGHLPPPERRALVIIDPSYEMKSDFEDVAQALVRAHRRFAPGTFLLWYPVIDRSRTEFMLGGLGAMAPRQTTRLELIMAEDGSRRGMTASGLFIINAPAALLDGVERGLAWTAQAMGGGARFVRG